MSEPTEAFYCVTPSRVERICSDGETSEVYDEPSLYDDLVFAGYPLSSDESLGGYYVDIAVYDGERVIAFTQQPAAEHDMGAVSGLFLAWRVLHDHEPDEPRSEVSS